MPTVCHNTRFPEHWPETKRMSSTAFDVKNYAEIRRTIALLHEKIIRFTSRPALTTCGRHLGILRNNVFVFDNEIESHMLFDYLVYAYRPNGINMAELYLRTHRSTLDPVSIDLLERMSRCLYLFLSAQSVGPGNSLQVLDMFHNTVFTLVDNNLSTSAEPGQAFATHVIDLGSFSIQTGAIIGVDRRLATSDELIAAWTKWEKQGVYDLKISAKMAKATMISAMRLGCTENSRTAELEAST